MLLNEFCYWMLTEFMNSDNDFVGSVLFFGKSGKCIDMWTVMQKGPSGLSHCHQKKDGGTCAITERRQKNNNAFSSIL